MASASVSTERLTLIHDQRYAMGTMFDVLVYHASRGDAERAIGNALDEIVRLDGVLSHFKTDGGVARLNAGARGRFVEVEPALYEVLQESLAVSLRSGGRFDVTIAPLLRTWNRARAEGRRPSDAEIAEARRCVGYEKIDLAAPDRIRFRSDCLEIDLGGIGKGYAVDRALAILEAAGVRHAVINAGSSSIAAIGSPPGDCGWPVSLPAPASGSRTLRLRDASLATSEQDGSILDPLTGAPAPSPMLISVVAPKAAVSDALSTTLVLLSVDEGKEVLNGFAGVSAMWIAPDGGLGAVHGEVPACG